MKKLRAFYNQAHDLAPIDHETILGSNGLGILKGWLILMGIFIIAPFIILWTFLLGIFVCGLDIFFHYYDKKALKNKEDNVKKIIKEYEEELNREIETDPICFHSYVKNGDTSLKQWLLLFFSTNNNHPTIYADTKDSEKVMYQCSAGRRRSLGDIYMICKYYYPDCTLEEVLKNLLWMLKGRLIGGSHCNLIHKFVFHTDSYVYKKGDPIEFTDVFVFSDFEEVYKD